MVEEGLKIGNAIGKVEMRNARGELDVFVVGLLGMVMSPCLAGN